MTTGDRVFEFIVNWKAANDGLSPTGKEIAEAFGYSEPAIRYHLKKLESEGKITIVRYGGIKVNGGSWQPPEGEPGTANPVAQEHDQLPDLATIPGEYEPPRDLETARRDALHFWRASSLHLGTIEYQRRRIAYLESYIYGNADAIPDSYVRALEMENGHLQADADRLTTSLKTAVESWRKYENQARQKGDLLGEAHREIEVLSQDLEALQDEVEREVTYWRGRARWWGHIALTQRGITDRLPTIPGMFNHKPIILAATNNRGLIA